MSSATNETNDSGGTQSPNRPASHPPPLIVCRAVHNCDDYRFVALELTPEFLKRLVKWKETYEMCYERQGSELFGIEVLRLDVEWYTKIDGEVGVHVDGTRIAEWQYVVAGGPRGERSPREVLKAAATPPTGGDRTVIAVIGGDGVYWKITTFRDYEPFVYETSTLYWDEIVEIAAGARDSECFGPALLPCSDCGPEDGISIPVATPVDTDDEGDDEDEDEDEDEEFYDEYDDDENGDGEQFWVNYYRCPKCGTEWDDVYDAQPDDDCPACGCRHISPYKSVPEGEAGGEA